MTRGCQSPRLQPDENATRRLDRVPVPVTLHSWWPDTISMLLSGRQTVLEVCVLGPSEVRVDGAARPSGARKRQTLAVSALQPGRVVGVEELIDATDAVRAHLPIELAPFSRSGLMAVGSMDLEWLEAERNYIRGYCDDILDVHQRGLHAAQSANDLVATAVMHNYIASAHQRTGRHQESVDHLRAALELAIFREALQRRWPHYSEAGFSQALANLGLALTLAGRCREVLRAHRSHLFAGSASCIEKDDSAEACRHWERVLVLYRKMSAPEQFDIERRLDKSRRSCGPADTRSPLRVLPGPGL